jgi:hypothetical protein
VIRGALICTLAAACGHAKPAAAPAVENQPPPPAEPAVSNTGASLKECDRLLEHLVDLEFAAAQPSTEADLETQKANVIASKRDEVRQACLMMSRAQVRCALHAPTLDAVQACDQATGHTPR